MRPRFLSDLRSAGWASLCAVFAIGCARGFRDPAVGSSDLDAPPQSEPRGATKRAAPPRHRHRVRADAVENAALPYHGIRQRDCELVSDSELMNELARADAVCVGEDHPNPHHHFAQLTVLRELAARARMTGRELGLGLEMFELRAQAGLDAYAARKIETEELLARAEWEQRWGYDFALYRPMVEHARKAGLAILALNAPGELTRRVARSGLGALGADDRKNLPELDLDDSGHRAYFDAAMHDHPKGHGDPENLYAAQVLWDETMADTAARWLLARQPARQIVILAGNGHCHDSAIPARVRRRAGRRVVSVRPILEGEDEDLGSALSNYDYGLILRPPAGLAEKTGGSGKCQQRRKGRHGARLHP